MGRSNPNARIRTLTRHGNVTIELVSTLTVIVIATTTLGALGTAMSTTIAAEVVTNGSPQNVSAHAQAIVMGGLSRQLRRMDTRIQSIAMRHRHFAGPIDSWPTFPNDPSWDRLRSTAKAANISRVEESPGNGTKTRGRFDQLVAAGDGLAIWDTARDGRVLRINKKRTESPRGVERWIRKQAIGGLFRAPIPPNPVRFRFTEPAVFPHDDLYVNHLRYRKASFYLGRFQGLSLAGPYSREFAYLVGPDRRLLDELIRKGVVSLVVSDDPHGNWAGPDWVRVDRGSGIDGGHKVLVDLPSDAELFRQKIEQLPDRIRSELARIPDAPAVR